MEGEKGAFNCIRDGHALDGVATRFFPMREWLIILLT